jgi:hypothetical protein
LISGFAAILAVFARGMGFFMAFKLYVNICMKNVDFTALNKIEVLILAICMGCRHTRDINFDLKPYTALSYIMNIPRIPDQSQINRIYHRLDIYNLFEIQQVMDTQIRQYCIPLLDEGKVDIDIDTTGIVAYGETYELRRKGYFSHQQGKKGYQLTVAVTGGDYNFIVAGILDPGNYSPGCRFFDIIYTVAETLGSLDKIGIIRADRAHGTGPNIEELVEMDREFVIKAFSGKTSVSYINKIGSGNIQWVEITDIVRVSDIGNQDVPYCAHKVRVVLIETIVKKGRILEKEYTHLYVRLKRDVMDEAEVFNYYGKRQVIESVFDADKNGLALTALKCRNFIGLSASISFTFMAYNLLCLFREKVLSELKLKHLGIKEIVRRLMDIPAKVKKEDGSIKLIFPKNHPYTKNIGTSEVV